MTPKTLTASRTVRINTGNYEGTEYHVSIVGELDELDDFGDSLAELNEAANNAMLAQLQSAYRAGGKKELSLDAIKRRHAIA